MTREELKAEALINLGSEPAPKEWEKLTCIKEQMPSCIGGEVSLQRFVGTDICAWFVGIGGLWEPQSDYFRVSLPPAEGAVPDNAAEQNKRMREWFKERTGLDDTLLSIHMEQIDVMLKGVQQQATAEGAEEIDDETIAWAAEHQCGTPFSERWIGFVKGAKWHRSLHAQRIAEKMVSEKLMWIRVSDELPKEHQQVLCYNGYRISQHSWNEYTNQDANWFKNTFTHWSTLPKLPDNKS